MCLRVRKLWLITTLALIFTSALVATSIPRVSFEQLTDASEIVASGRVTQSWTAWDSEHKYIWTHYLLAVSDVAKGAASSTVEFAEPGGSVGDSALVITGTVTYQIGSDVVVFLSRMPNGYLRTAGWAQGKYEVDAAGRLHGVAASGTETIERSGAAAGSPLATLDGVGLRELKQRVAARVRANAGRLQ